MVVDDIKENLRSQPLPKYSRGEETFNWVSHLIGVVFGLVTLVIAIVFTIQKAKPALTITPNIAIQSAASSEHRKFKQQLVVPISLVLIRY